MSPRATKAAKPKSTGVRFPPASFELAKRLEELMPKGPGFTRGKMFGCPCVFVSGKLSFFVFGDSLVLRLGEDDREALLAIDGAVPFAPMPGRTSKASVIVPPKLTASDAKLRPWIEKAIAFAQAKASGAKPARATRAGGTSRSPASSRPRRTSR
jgi:TfoX/Sxy family transcriptional regulator of competence genes